MAEVTSAATAQWSVRALVPGGTGEGTFGGGSFGDPVGPAALWSVRARVTRTAGATWDVNVIVPMALSGTGVLTVSGTPMASGSASFDGSGELTVDTAIHVGLDLGGAGTLTTASGGLTTAGPAGLTGAGVLTVQGVPGPTGTPALSGSGTLTVLGVPAPTGAASLAGSGTLTAVRTAWGITGSAAFAGTGTLAAAMTAWGLRGTVALAGTGTLTGLSLTIATGTVDVGGTGVLTAIGVVGPAGIEGGSDRSFRILTRESGVVHLRELDSGNATTVHDITVPFNVEWQTWDDPAYGLDGQVYFVNHTDVHPWDDLPAEARALWNAINTTTGEITTGPALPEAPLDGSSYQFPWNRWPGFDTWAITVNGLFIFKDGWPDDTENLEVYRFANLYDTTYTLTRYPIPDGYNFLYAAASDGRNIYATDSQHIVKFDSVDGTLERLWSEPLGSIDVLADPVYRPSDGMIYVPYRHDGYDSGAAFGICRINNGQREDLYEEPVAFSGDPASPVIGDTAEVMFPYFMGGYVVEPYMFFFGAVHAGFHSTGPGFGSYWFTDEWAWIRFNLDTQELDRRWKMGTSNAYGPVRYCGYDQPTLSGDIASTKRWFISRQRH